MTILRMFVFGIFISAITTEVLWFLLEKLFPRARQISYSYLREYQESFEPYEMAIYRDSMTKLFINKISDCISENELSSLYWKTWSGEPKIFDAIYKSLCKYFSIQTGILWEDRNSDVQRKEIYDAILTYFSEPGNNDKIRIILPVEKINSKIAFDIENKLGITPRFIQDVGVRRYLVINRKTAVISIPIPANYSTNGNGKKSISGSNFAICVEDPSRIHDCLIEFNSLYS